MSPSLRFSAALVVASCIPRADAPTRPSRPVSSAPEAEPQHQSPPRDATAESVASNARPRRGLTIAEARRLMLDLINRDRASMGLAPVAFDDGPATHAGQAHAEDMAKHGYLGHWGTDGSVPEQRFTEAGGADMVLENASCFTDEKTRTLDRAPLIDAKNVELAEDMFFHEKPPHDGHRRNILKPWHKRVGIGIAQPVATQTEIPAPCIAQEFVDPYGSYAAVPRRLRVGDVLHLSGAVSSPATFAGVGLARVDEPAPMLPAELNRLRTYPVPAPYQMYWPLGYQTPIVVKVNGGRFGIDVPVSDQGRPGMYEVSVWATFPGSDDLVIVGLRTIRAAAR